MPASKPLPLLAMLRAIEPSPPALAAASASGADLQGLLRQAEAHLVDCHRIIRQLILLTPPGSDEAAALADVLMRIA
jgi:hypothetical protein